MKDKKQSKDKRIVIFRHKQTSVLDRYIDDGATLRQAVLLLRDEGLIPDGAEGEAFAESPDGTRHEEPEYVLQKGDVVEVGIGVVDLRNTDAKFDAEIREAKEETRKKETKMKKKEENKTECKAECKKKSARGGRCRKGCDPDGFSATEPRDPFLDFLRGVADRLKEEEAAHCPADKEGKKRGRKKKEDCKAEDKELIGQLQYVCLKLLRNRNVEGGVITVTVPEGDGRGEVRIEYDKRA